MTETVVITGASARHRPGHRPAVRRARRQRRADRPRHAGLAGAAEDVEEAGGKALAVTADVADYGQVEDAARQVEDAVRPDRHLGQRRVHLGVRAVRRHHARRSSAG